MRTSRVFSSRTSIASPCLPETAARRRAGSLLATASRAPSARFLGKSARRSEGQAIALGAKSHDSTMRDIRNRRMMPERFAPIHVRQMHLDHWNTHGLDGVANRNAGVRVCARIDQEYVALAARLLNSIDDPAFAVRLKRLNPHFKLASQVLEFLVDISQAGSAIDFRLAFAEKIQVGSMDHQHGHWPARAARYCRTSRLPGFGHHLPRSAPRVH